jgi:hypothetical protein
MLRSGLKTTLLILSCVIAVFGLVATIIQTTQSAGAGVAYYLFWGLAQTCALAAIPGGIYCILVGQDMHMRHIGVSMPQSMPRPQGGYPQGGYPQGGYPQGGYPQRPGNYR